MILAYSTYNTGKRYLPFFLSENKSIELYSLLTAFFSLYFFDRILKSYREAWDESPMEFAARQARSQRISELAQGRLHTLLEEIREQRLNDFMNYHSALQ